MVPVMAAGYIALGLFVTFKNVSAVPAMFGKIFSQAFDLQAIFGGFAGSCVMQGVKRGLYSNEARAWVRQPTPRAAADVSHPVKQGLVRCCQCLSLPSCLFHHRLHAAFIRGADKRGTEGHGFCAGSGV